MEGGWAKKKQWLDILYAREYANPAICSVEWEILLPISLGDTGWADINTPLADGHHHLLV